MTDAKKRRGGGRASPNNVTTPSSCTWGTSARARPRAATARLRVPAARQCQVKHFSKFMVIGAASFAAQVWVDHLTEVGMVPLE